MYKNENRKIKRDEALNVVRRLFDLPIKYIAIENPPGYLNKNFKRPSQTFSPFQFGDNYKKQTSFWLKNLPVIMPQYAEFNSKLKKVDNHTNSRMSQELKSKIKSNWKYFPLTVETIVNQWSYFLKKQIPEEKK